MKTWLLNAFLRLCPEVPYEATAGKPWLWLKRVHIKREGSEDVYLQRFILIRWPLGAVYLHRFLRGDEDKCLHDHPVNFVSIILRGGYWEETPGGILTWIPAGSVRYCPATLRHRVILDENRNGPTWTLFISGPKVRSWGFWTNGGKTWVPWKQFIDGGSQGCE